MIREEAREEEKIIRVKEKLLEYYQLKEELDSWKSETNCIGKIKLSFEWLGTTHTATYATLHIWISAMLKTGIIKFQLRSDFVKVKFN